MQSPAIQSANRKKEYVSPSYQAIFLDQIVSNGKVQYQFLIAVFKPGAEAPFFIVTSEKSNPLASFDLHDLFDDEEEDLFEPVVGQTIYFLAYFDEKGHYNLGSSPNWAEETAFEKRALALMEEKLGKSFRVV